MNLKKKANVKSKNNYFWVDINICNWVAETISHLCSVIFRVICY